MNALPPAGEARARRFALGLLWLAALGRALAAETASTETLAETARPSVVIISQVGRDGKDGGVGAGFVVGAEGLIATSLHVIGESRPAWVELANGRRFEVAGIHAWDRKLDLAVIRIAATNLPPLPLGDSDRLKQGAPVVAMGNPLGLDLTFVSGLVSARREFDGQPAIQVAMPIEPGNSGGPLLDAEGRVVGIVNMKSLLAPNLGFATPVNALKSLLDRPNPVPMSRWLTFNTLNPDEWQPLMGARWRQRGGRIEVEGAGTGFGGRALALQRTNAPAEPFELGVTVRLGDESGAAGLAWASDGGDRHYGFYPSAGQLRLTRFDGPTVFTWNILRQVATPHYRPGEWNRLKVRVEASRILCYVNGQLAIESDDAEWRGGKAGLAKFRDTQASFKDFAIGPDVSGSLENVPGDTAAARAIVDDATSRNDDELLAALAPHAATGQPLLVERARQLEREAARLRAAAVRLHRQSVQRELVRSLDRPEAEIDLAHAALLLARHDNAEVDVPAYRRQLEGMGRDLLRRVDAQAPDTERVAALKKFLFEENGFHGSRSDYYNRANSYLSDALDDREGLPITLAVVFLDLAQRIGLTNVAGLPVPGHFMVKFTPAEGAPQLIDVFEGGRSTSFWQADELASSFQGLPIRTELMDAATKREILARMLRNLIGVSSRTGAETAALPYLDLLIAIVPNAPEERLQRARLRVQRGEREPAREDLLWLLDHTPPGLNRDRLEELLRNL